MFRIIHVDDSKLSLKLGKKIIPSVFEGSELVSVQSSEFLSLMENGYSLSDVDILITDLLMPEVSGHEVLKYVKSKNKSIFLAVLSSNIQNLEKMKSYENGADYFIEKPLTVEKLERMWSHVSSKKI